MARPIRRMTGPMMTGRPRARANSVRMGALSWIPPRVSKKSRAVHMPRIVAQTSAAERLAGVTPALASVPPRPAAEEIQKPFTHGVSAKEAKYGLALRRLQGPMAADQLIVTHAPVGQHHCPPRSDAHASATPEASTNHDGIEEITVQAKVRGN